MTEPLLSARELAAYLGVHVDTVYKMVQEGVIPVAFRAGPRLRFDRSAVDAIWPPEPSPLTRDGRPRRVRLSKGVDWELTDEQIAALPTRGLVYFIQSTRGGPIKIGLTTNIDRRLSALQAACPFPLVVLATIPGGRRREYELHRQFAAGRKHGEWFGERTPGLIDLIREAAA